MRFKPSPQIFYFLLVIFLAENATMLIIDSDLAKAHNSRVQHHSLNVTHFQRQNIEHQNQLKQ